MKSLEGRVETLEQTDKAEAKEAGLIRLTGLWRGESKAGQTYLSGSLSPSSRLLILPNSHKRQASDPDYVAYLAPQEKKEGAQPAKIGGL